MVETKPLALNLDVDIVRAQLGGWLGDPIKAGLAARRLATQMAAVHLTAGFDVVVPQFLGKTEFIEQLESVASATGANFVEVVLGLDRDAAAAAFAERRSNPTDQTHLDASALLDQSQRADPLGEMWDALQRVVELRPRTYEVRVVRGDIDSTFQALMVVLDEATSDGHTGPRSN